MKWVLGKKIFDYYISLFWFLRTNQTSPIKTCPMKGKKQDNKSLKDDLQMFHFIVIYTALKKCSKRSYKKKYFIFKTLKSLTLQLQFWEILGTGAIASPPKNNIDTIKII